MSAGVPETPAQPVTEGQDPAPAPTTPTPAPPAEGPWADTLNRRFTDPAVRTQVDEYLRDTVQPYTTRLEAQTAAAKEAQEFYKAFEDNPVQAYLAVTDSIFEEDAKQAIIEALEHVAETPEGEATATEGLDPRVEDAVKFVEQFQQTNHYNAEMERVTGLDDNKDVDPDLLHPFVAAAGGDFDTAVAGYKEWYAKVEGKFGKIPEKIEVPNPAAQQVIGSDSQTPSAPPVQKEYTSFDDAMEDFFVDLRANAAPSPVGSS